VPTQRPVNAAGLEPRRPASLFHFIPGRSSDRQRPPVVLFRASPRSQFIPSSARSTRSRFVGRKSRDDTEGNNSLTISG
jgi:hypothetical protein